MTPVYQTIISPENGNCMQAALASLFDKELDDVPNFVEYDNWTYKCVLWLRDLGYQLAYVNACNLDGKITLKDVLEYDGGVNGYFYASVPSQTFPGVTHAVIIDKEGNVVHDPNPNGLCLKLTAKDIIQVMTTKRFYITEDGNKIESLEIPEWTAIFPKGSILNKPIPKTGKTLGQYLDEKGSKLNLL